MYVLQDLTNSTDLDIIQPLSLLKLHITLHKIHAVYSQLLPCAAVQVSYLRAGGNLNSCLKFSPMKLTARGYYWFTDSNIFWFSVLSLHLTVSHFRMCISASAPALHLWLLSTSLSCTSACSAPALHLYLLSTSPAPLHAQHQPCTSTYSAPALHLWHAQHQPCTSACSPPTLQLSHAQHLWSETWHSEISSQK